MESTLLRTFEMLIERLARVEEKQDQVLKVMKDAVEAAGEGWIPGRLLCGEDVKIIKHARLPLESSDDFVCVRFEWKRYDSQPLEDRVYFQWVMDSQDHGLNVQAFLRDVRDALIRVREKHKELLERGDHATVYAPLCEELGILEGKKLDRKLTIGEWVTKEVATMACGNKGCSILYVSYENPSVVCMWFPSASRDAPVGLCEIVQTFSRSLEGFRVDLSDIHEITLKRAELSLLPLYIALLQEGVRDDTDAFEVFRKLPGRRRSEVCLRARAESDLFHPWEERLQNWNDDS